MMLSDKKFAEQYFSNFAGQTPKRVNPKKYIVVVKEANVFFTDRNGMLIMAPKGTMKRGTEILGVIKTMNVYINNTIAIMDFVHFYSKEGFLLYVRLRDVAPLESVMKKATTSKYYGITGAESSFTENLSVNDEMYSQSNFDLYCEKHNTEAGLDMLGMFRDDRYGMISNYADNGEKKGQVLMAGVTLSSLYLIVAMILLVWILTSKTKKKAS